MATTAPETATHLRRYLIPRFGTLTHPLRSQGGGDMFVYGPGRPTHRAGSSRRVIYICGKLRDAIVGLTKTHDVNGKLWLNDVPVYSVQQSAFELSPC